MFLCLTEQGIETCASGLGNHYRFECMRRHIKKFESSLSKKWCVRLPKITVGGSGYEIKCCNNSQYTMYSKCFTTFYTSYFKGIFLL